MLKYKSKPSSLSLFSKNLIINKYYLCNKKNTKKEKKGKVQEERQKRILFSPKYALAHSNQWAYHCPSGIMKKGLKKTTFKLISTLLPTTKPTVFSKTVVQISIHNHSCLLCESRSKMLMKEKAGPTLYKDIFTSLSKRISGNRVRGEKLSKKYFLSLDR